MLEWKSEVLSDIYQYVLTRYSLISMFGSFKTQQERELSVWISSQGGENEVLQSDEKCKELLERETELLRHDEDGMAMQPTSGRGRGGARVAPSTELIANLRKECREDLEQVLSKNMDVFAKRFEMGLDQLNNDLTNKIEHQGDRIIEALNDGPHNRLKDKVRLHPPFRSSVLPSLFR
jgi:hypothetical protein